MARALSEANRFDVIAVRIEQERGIVRWAVVGPQAGSAVVAASRLQAFLVEAIDRGAVACAERNVDAASIGTLGGIEPQRRLALGTETRARIVARAKHEAEPRERGAVEAHARFQIFHLQANVVEHG